MSIVVELQRDALNPNVSVAVLLRKAYVVATKLKLDVFKTWIKRELDGYGEGSVPEYRIIRGAVRARAHRLIPVIFPDEFYEEVFSTLHEGSSVSVIQDLVDSNQPVMYSVLNVARQQEIIRSTGMRWESVLEIARGAVVAILDAVRNIILDWSLRLEEDGILGIDMSFSDAEKLNATKHAESLQAPVICLIGEMVNSTVQIASPNSVQRNHDGKAAEARGSEWRELAAQ